MRGRKQNAVATGKEIAAGGAALAGADQLGSRGLAVGRIDRHGVDLVAGDAFALVLEDQLLIVGGKVSFGILTAEGELAHVLQVLLSGGRRIREGWLLRARRVRARGG